MHYGYTGRMKKLMIALLALLLIAAASAQEKVGAWTLETHTDAGVNRSFIYTPELVTGVGALYFRCAPASEVGVEMFLFTQLPIGNATQYVVSYQLDGNPEQRAVWAPSADQTGVFAQSYEVDLFAMPAVFQEAKSAVVTVRLPSGAERPYRFSVEGFEAALSRLGCYQGLALR